VGLSALPHRSVPAETRHVPEPRALPPIGDVIDPLSEAECRQLLARHTLGRVGLTNGGLPLILPVHYAYDDGVIGFRTSPGTKLRAAANGDVLAFEVDTYDEESGQGWSVMVLGRAAVLTIGRWDDGHPSPDGAAPREDRYHYVRLFCEVVTGRVIQRESDALSSRSFARRRLS